MRVLKSTWLFAILFSLAFTACQPEAPVPDDSLQYLPESTAMVTAIRPNQLMEKADFKAIQQSESYQEMIQEARSTNPVLAKVLEQPESSGVDLGKNIYLAAEVREGKKPFMTISFSIADAPAFEALLKSVDADAQPASDNGYQFLNPSKNTTLAWNENVAIIGIAEDDTDVEAAIKQYLANGPERSIAQNKNLRRALAKEYDIANWLSSDFLLESELAKNSTALMNYKPEDLRGNYIQHFLTFDKGAITSEASLYFKNQVANDLGMLFHDKVKTDFAKLAPEGEPLFFMATAFDMEGINQLLVEKYSKGLAEGGLKEYGISTNTLIKALKGDIMLAGYGPEEEGKSPELVFAAPIGDKEALQSIINIAVKDNKIEKISENRYRFMEWKREMKDDSTYAESKVHIDGQLLIHDGLLYLASQPAHLDKVEKGQTGITGPIAGQAKALSGNNIFTLLGDIEAMDAMGNEHKEGFSEVKSIEATAHRKGTALTLKMKDESANSLKILMDMMKRTKHQEEPAEEKPEAPESGI
ncbi:MAG: DUF4836 family protein [Phaeodactylibacter sp.]|nr:DUF4836 family protein [Phaeodactylibacter sp.]MCB9052422.1 DUF4836 family protein [Lewinellaceae bacterium]